MLSRYKNALAGCLALAIAFAARPAEANLVYRWSFNDVAASAPAGTNFRDSISGAVATVKGNGALLTGSSLTLSGTTTGAVSDAAIAAYVDLPNGIISSRTNLTVELWATPVSSKKWQRFFDFGRMISGDGSGAAGEWNGASAPSGSRAYDQLMLAENNTTLNNMRNAARHGYTGSGTAGPEFVIDSSANIAAGTQHHYVVVFEDGLNVDGTSNPAGARMIFYLDGNLMGAVNIAFHLSNLADVNNWLGRSQWSGDSMANISYNEVRIYNQALTANEIGASLAAGPNATFVAPVANADSATMHYNQKVRLPVLANDTGGVIPSQIAIVQPPQSGSAVAQSDGTILYTNTTGTAASDSFTYRVGGYVGTSNAAPVTINFSNSLRLGNTTLTVPATAPATAFQVSPAFSGTASDFNQPVCLATPPGDTKRLFVCEKTGVLKLIPDVTASSPVQSSFLNVAALLTSRGESISTQSEQGLLGLAFHPNYASNGFFYVFYSATSGTSVYERVSRFKVQSGNPNAADTTSELNLINQLDVSGNHNGGDVHFGPDGYLYVSLGDGGSQNDSLGNAQRIDRDFFSGLLRIDVDKKSGSRAPNTHPAVMLDGTTARYAVPPDNPFVGATSFNGSAVTPGNVRTEFWAVGMRNPWRFSFDPATGDLWCGDVGQGAYEEVDLVTKGGNYGWSFREANHNGPRAATAPANFDTLYHQKPRYEYAHAGINSPGNPSFEGAAVIGGVVYRGARMPSLTGSYIFGDAVSGHVWSLVRSGTSNTVTRLTGESGISAFGVDPSNGDVLLTNSVTGSVDRLFNGTVSSSFPSTLSATGVFADLTDLAPNPGVLPYEPNLAFWSDFAAKRRWFVIPDTGSKMTWSRDGVWTFPAGEIWVKHFDMPLTRTNPPTTNGTVSKRIETRLLVKNAAGVYGVSYRWNDAGTDATLVADAGADFDIALTQNGQPYTQRWHIPSRAECITCHNAQAGGALSFNTRQLNAANVINGFAGNQIELLKTAGYFSNTPDPSNTLRRHSRPDDTNYPVEARVRSYLAVNCGYCHQAGGTSSSWDGRPQLTLTQTGLINGAATAALHAGDQLVVPNDLTHSIVYNRVALTNGYTRMPPLASNELDQADIALLQKWITQSLPSRQTYDDWHLAQFGVATPPGGDGSADADGDGETNYQEFLAGSGPLTAASRFSYSFSAGSGMVTLKMNIPANRSVTVETSPDLAAWKLWDVPGNGGDPRPGGGMTILTGVAGQKQFFRWQLQEN